MRIASDNSSHVAVDQADHAGFEEGIAKAVKNAQMAPLADREEGAAVQIATDTSRAVKAIATQDQPAAWEHAIRRHRTIAKGVEQGEHAAGGHLEDGALIGTSPIKRGAVKITGAALHELGRGRGAVKLHDIALAIHVILDAQEVVENRHHARRRHPKDGAATGVAAATGRAIKIAVPALDHAREGGRPIVGHRAKAVKNRDLPGGRHLEHRARVGHAAARRCAIKVAVPPDDEFIGIDSIRRNRAVAKTVEDRHLTGPGDLVRGAPAAGAAFGGGSVDGAFHPGLVGGGLDQPRYWRRTVVGHERCLKAVKNRHLAGGRHFEDGADVLGITAGTGAVKFAIASLNQRPIR